MKSRAWLLDFGNDLKAAVGLHEIFQVLLSAELFEVPCTPIYCNEVLIMRQRILPVLDIPSLLEGRKPLSMHKEVIGIVAYQEDPKHAVHHAGLRLVSLPVSISVDDSQACQLPKEQKIWQSFSYACFSYEDETIPILNLCALFCQDLTLCRI